MITTSDFMLWLVGTPLIVGSLCFVFGYLFAKNEQNEQRKD